MQSTINHGYWSLAPEFHNLVIKMLLFPWNREIWVHSLAHWAWAWSGVNKRVTWGDNRSGIGSGGIRSLSRGDSISRHFTSIMSWVQPVQVSLTREAGSWLISSQVFCPCKVLLSKPEVKDEFSFYLWIFYLPFIDRGLFSPQVNSTMLSLFWFDSCLLKRIR